MGEISPISALKHNINSIEKKRQKNPRLYGMISLYLQWYLKALEVEKEEDMESYRHNLDYAECVRRTIAEEFDLDSSSYLPKQIPL